MSVIPEDISATAEKAFSRALICRVHAQSVAIIAEALMAERRRGADMGW